MSAVPEAATTPSVSMRILPLPAGDLVFDATAQKLYASVPSAPLSLNSLDPNTQQIVAAQNTIGNRRNSITSIDPFSVSLGESWPVGSEPQQLALSEGGRYLYANLTGSRALRRIDLSTHTVEPPFWLGEQTYIDENNPVNGGLLSALNMIALPGHPESLVVNLGDGLAIYDNGVRRPQVPTYGDLRRSLTASSSNTLYASDYVGNFKIFSVSDAGVSTVGTIRYSDLLKAYVHEMKYSNGLIYTSNGQVIDPSGSPRVVAELFKTPPGFEPLSLILPEPSLNLVYYLIPTHGITDDKYGAVGTVTVRAYNTQTFTLVGSFDIPNVIGRIKGFTRWGGNGLAFCAGNEVYVIRTSLIPSADPLDLPVPAPSATPTPPPVFPKTVREVPLANNDILYDAKRGVIYASVPAYAPNYGNSVATLDPKTGAVISSVSVGVDPGKLALSRDGHYLYIGLNGSQAIRRLNLDTQTPDLQFPIAPLRDPYPPFNFFPEPIYVVDMEVLPDNPQSVAVARMHIQGPYTRFVGMGIYDNGVLRPNASFGAMETFAFYDADTIYGATRAYYSPASAEVTLTSRGAVTKGIASDFLSGDFKIENGLAFLSYGRVVDPLRVRFVGMNIIPGLSTFPQFPQVAPDVAAGRAYYLTGLETPNGSGSPQTWKIHSFDLSNNWLVGTTEIPGVKGSAAAPIRCGMNCLAFGTSRDQIFVVESSMIVTPTPTPAPTPTPSPTPTPTYTLSGRATDAAGQGLSDVTLIISGSITGTRQVKTDSSGNYTLTYTPDIRYQLTPAKNGYVFEPRSTTFTSHTLVTGDRTANFSASPTSSASTINVSYNYFYEDQGKVTLSVTRDGDVSGGAAVDYETIDDMSPVRCDVANGIAYARCDYISAAGTLLFSAGESTRTFTILVVDDAHREGIEPFNYKFSNPVGIAFPPQSIFKVAIRDKTVLAGGSNPIYQTWPFVRQQYFDFFGREPETEGFRAWRDVLDTCSDVNNNPACDRVTVSSAFFRSQEFQLKGYFVYRFYRASFGRLPRYAEMISDMLRVTGQTPDEVVQKRAAFSVAWTERPEFKALYPASMTDIQYVDKLLQTLNVTLTGDVTRETLLADLSAGRKNRSDVLRVIVEHPDVDKKEYNGAFVAMQYFGYLRRDPEPEGYQAWLNYLNTHPTDYRTMVHGFVNSTEYRLRFGQP